jgi:hypothetical protein
LTRPQATRLLAATGLALLGLTAGAVGQEVSTPPFGVAGFEIERLSWVGSVAPGRGITVLNRFGDVRARFGGYEDRLELFANVQHFASEGARLVVQASETQTGIEVTVGYRTTEGGELVALPDPGHKKRADLVVYVPQRTPLSVSSDHGLVDVRGLESDVRARTASGGIIARKVDGELDFETGSGDVLVRLERWDSARDHSFASGSGDLSVVLAGEVDATISVATSGLISTDYSMDVDYQSDRRPLRRGEARIGEGSCLISISSTDGHVRLIRRPLARQAGAPPETGS